MNDAPHGGRPGRIAPDGRSSRLVRRLAMVSAAALLGLGAAALPAQASSRGPTPRVGAADEREAGHALNIVASDMNDASTDMYSLSTRHVQAGLVRVALSNVGMVPHQAQLVRLHTGVTPKGYKSALLASQGGAALVLADATGGPGAVDPGGSQVTYVNLRPGRYVVLCFQSAGDHGAPHFVNGMFSSFAVTGRYDPDRPEGVVRGTVNAYSFGFRMPAVIRSHGLYRFVNTATSDTHELALLKLAPGKTAADFLTWAKAGMGQPPVVADSGGGGAVAPGGSEWVRMNLTPGNYVATCFVPDDMPPHLPHVDLGMVRGFRVVR